MSIVSVFKRKISILVSVSAGIDSITSIEL